MDHVSVHAVPEEILSLTAGGRISGLQNVVVLPMAQGIPPPLISDHITQTVQTAAVTVPATFSSHNIQFSPSLPIHITHTPAELYTGGEGDILSSADESLADLQPDSEGEEEDQLPHPPLSLEQRKLEFMAALGLVPPAVLEEIHRRQELCKAEYGNWWDRLHSTDFCLVPKSESVLSNLQIMAEEVSEAPSHDIQQVAGGPDAGALVEQITYLTSWPQPSTTDTVNTVEVVTQQTPVEDHRLAIAAAQLLREHYLIEKQNTDGIQAALQHLAGFTLPPSS